MRTCGFLPWVGCYGFVLLTAGCGGSTTDAGASEAAGGRRLGSTAGAGGSGGSTAGSGGSGGSTAGAGSSGAAAGGAGTAGHGGSARSGMSGGHGGADDPGDCDVQVAEARVASLDMMILIDRSGSMDYGLGPNSADDRWSATTGALRDFIRAPRVGEVGVGVQFFPLEYEGPMPVPLMDQGCELHTDDCRPLRTASPTPSTTTSTSVTRRPATKASGWTT